jgi:hypothetical protein
LPLNGTVLKTSTVLKGRRAMLVSILKGEQPVYTP